MTKQTTTITVGGRTLTVPLVYVKFYDTYMGITLENMAQIYLCVEYKANETIDAVKGRSDKELVDTILSWADAEISVMGVGLADVR